MFEVIEVTPGANMGWEPDRKSHGLFATRKGAERKAKVVWRLTSGSVEIVVRDVHQDYR